MFANIYLNELDQDLIETYWNVNMAESYKRKPPQKDLIETYWNVNRSKRLARPTMKTI